jgi:hypothetical protein
VPGEAAFCRVERRPLLEQPTPEHPASAAPRVRLDSWRRQLHDTTVDNLCI